jgi:predicted nucleic acid-binding protein
METMDANGIFIDTNVLVYGTVVNAPLHEIARQVLQNLSAASNDLWISRQVIREYLATLSRSQTFTTPISIATLVADVQYFENQFLVAEDNFQVTQNLLTLIEQVPTAGKQIHDANIVATMQAYNIPILLTHNVADFKRFTPLITLLTLEVK